MKSSRVILALAALVLLFGALTVWAQDEYCLPLVKQINPGSTTVKFDRIAYSFLAENSFSVKFEKLDATHVKLHAKPLIEQPSVTPEMTVQWGNFPGVCLIFGSTG